MNIREKKDYPKDWRDNKDITYERKFSKSDEKIFECDLETSQKINAFLERGITTLKVTRRDKIGPDGKKHESYDIEPANEAGQI